MNEAININEVLAMDGHEISKLTVEQRKMLDLAFLKSRQYGLAIAVTNKATSEDLAKASSSEDAERIMAEAGSIVSVRKP
ncbi:hypothetical protein KUW00_06510 [Halomonas sp. DP5N14-9]|uniref:hypothetical protein n=1 Tax=Halomonas sp. DP5N14-9 TaxID=2859075 RepID=UPI001C99BB19|nr:hypothetical protein [Halomonas sp. DP5N14-9]MBY5940534.1 hypothetical protein [Halomonas sp. DP5N14-9]